MVTALVLINADRTRIPETAEELLQIDGVTEVWSVTGEYDLVATLRLREFEHLSTVVTEKMARLTSITKTHTMMAFRCYSKADLEQAYNIGVA